MFAVVLWAGLVVSVVTDDRVFGFLGGDGVLPCLLPDHTKLSLLEWLRPDLGPDAYLLFYREQREYRHYQHPRFSQRVVLRSTDLENGDLSVKLKNLTLEDTGTYSCVVRTSDRRTISSSVHLEVTEAQPRAGKLAGGGQAADLSSEVRALLLEDPDQAPVLSAVHVEAPEDTMGPGALRARVGLWTAGALCGAGSVALVALRLKLSPSDHSQRQTGV